MRTQYFNTFYPKYSAFADLFRSLGLQYFPLQCMAKANDTGRTSMHKYIYK